MNKLLCLFLFLFSVSQRAISQEKQDTTAKESKIRHTSKGFEFSTSDNKFLLQFASRLQFRFATPGDQNPVTFDDFAEYNTKLFKINRARLKIGGHAYEPWIKYYFEYEFAQSNLLDFRVMIEKWPWMKFKFGQWKTEFTRERFISSGDQQMVDRSIINRPFTVDRQQGVTVYGNLAGGGIANFDYWVAVLTGTGRGSTDNDDDKLMYFGRLQWNILGRPVPFEGGDMDISEKPAAILALSGVTNTSPYTRFSQDGGGYLEGFEDGLPGQYTVNQFQVETAFNYSGFSWASEIHRKYILDNTTGVRTELGGFYLQAGYFVHQAWNYWPKKLEVATRYAQYRPDVSISENRQREIALAFNYFFYGHKNKLTAELTRFIFQDHSIPQKDETRIRVQYDISF
ncbi:OprO/OprP family phosphate-selective porin [Algoriphagus jejuensis]